MTQDELMLVLADGLHRLGAPIRRDRQFDEWRVDCEGQTVFIEVVPSRCNRVYVYAGPTLKKKLSWRLLTGWRGDVVEVLAWIRTLGALPPDRWHYESPLTLPAADWDDAVFEVRNVSADT